MHKRIEAMKLAYSDVCRYNADPRICEVPVATLLSKEHAREARRADRSAHGQRQVAAAETRAGSDTTYLTVVDREGNIASWIQSIYQQFRLRASRSKAWASRCRIAARGSRSIPRIPTCSQAASARSTPSFPASWSAATQHIGFGIMGGPNQPLAHAQFVSNVVDYGMNLQQALESPRFTKNNPARLRRSIEVARARRRRCRNYPKWATKSQCAASTRKKWAAARRSCTIRTETNYAASDPRADGAATPEPIVK